MQHRIVVLGAGYTGAIAAGRLAKRLHREDVAITLVNPEPDFVERVRLHQLATGQDLTPRPFSEMFAGTGVELKLAKVSSVDVYWFQESGQGQIKLPANWQLFYRDGQEWKPVEASAPFGIAPDRYNHVAFKPVSTTALRLQVQLQPDHSAGISEWKVN